MHHLIPHNPTAGMICLSEDGGSLGELEREFLLSCVSEHGYVILRGFKADIGEFSRLVRSVSKRISLDPARSFNGDVAQKVDAGYDAVGLHCENGNSPFWPNLCWFYCEQSPSRGSQTTVCDGYAVFADMEPDARQLFSGQDIMYSRNVASKHWKTYVLHALSNQDGDAPRSIDEIELKHLLSLIDDPTAATVFENSDGSISYHFQVSAVRQSVLSKKSAPAFANSIFGPSYNYEKPLITLADGAAIPDQLLEALGAVCDQHTYDVGWKDHDVLLIDNTRVMHGRRPIDDKARVIYNALSYS